MWGPAFHSVTCSIMQFALYATAITAKRASVLIHRGHGLGSFFPDEGLPSPTLLESGGEPSAQQSLGSMLSTL